MLTQRDQFIQTYTPQAERVAAQLNVPVQGVLNHWGLETGWGKSIIPGTNNLGNIKDFSGGGVGATDNMTKTRDNYRQYATPDDFATDYAKLIGSNKRYAQALNTTSAYDFARGLQLGGYAQDPNFARKVAGMPIQNNNIVEDVAVAQAMGALPNARQAYIPGAGNIKVQQVNPEVAAEMEQIRQQKMAMLPYALAHSMSSNQGSQNFGQLLTALAMPAMDGTQLKNGRVMPSGQYVTDVSDAPEWAAYAKLMSAGNNGGLPGTISQFGYSPDGQRIVTSSKRGGQFTVSTDAQGNEVFTPYEGAVTPNGQYEKQVDAVTQALTSKAKADALAKQVEANPEAFSLKAGAISHLPASVAGWVGDRALSKDTLKTRADILRNAAMEINELYGAALSLGETQRANQFIPKADDPPGIVIEKLNAARNWADSVSQRYGQGVVKTAQQRAGQVSSAPPAGAPANPQGNTDPLGLRR